MNRKGTHYWDVAFFVVVIALLFTAQACMEINGQRKNLIENKVEFENFYNTTLIEKENSCFKDCLLIEEMINIKDSEGNTIYANVDGQCLEVCS